MTKLGQGTWRMGDRHASRAEEIAALRLGLDLGLNLIDTAELYGDGRAEELVAEAIAGRREHVYVVSKVMPSNATRTGTLAACERSLRRLGTDYLDLYLLHWRDGRPLDGTLEALSALQHQGKIRHYGVSNFDVDDLEEMAALPGGAKVATNQVLYNFTHRGIEWDLLRWCRAQAMTVMAYSPLGSTAAAQRRLFGHEALRRLAAKHCATVAQIALAWVLREDGIITIPKAGTPAHVRDNQRALDLTLDADDLLEIDRAFNPPRAKTALKML